jgi:hypothetical protein
MAEGCERIFENKTNWRQIIGTTQEEISQENIAFHVKEWWIVHNGPRQQTSMMFDNYRGTDGDERTTRSTIRRAFCN